MRGGQVVEQDTVGDLTGQAEHALIEGADDDLGPALAQARAQAEAGDPVEVALEVDALARQALPQQRHELPHLGQGALAVVGAVPAPGHHGRGDADPQDHLPLRGQGLEGAPGHGQERRGAQLEGEHPGGQVQAGGDLGHRPQGGEGLRPRRLGHPEGAVSQLLAPTGRLQGEGQAQALEAGRGEADGHGGGGHRAGTVADGAGPETLEAARAAALPGPATLSTISATNSVNVPKERAGRAVSKE